MWLPFWKAVSQISIWLVKKAFTINYSLICLVRQKCGWKGNCLDRRVKTLKCGWHAPDAGELALLLYINVTMSTPENVEISLLLEIYKQKEDPWNFHKYFFLIISGGSAPFLIAPTPGYCKSCQHFLLPGNLISSTRPWLFRL